jgi:4-amino-4-deoxy-L-arabinose transferase-like glycosyltransferase
LSTLALKPPQNTAPAEPCPRRSIDTRKLYLLVILFATAIYLGCIISPPSLMDDVDAVQAQIARNMLVSGDWVSARLDGVLYLEKSPLLYWAIALCYKAFGVHDWAARIPVALSAIGLSWLTAAFGIWAFGKRAGFYAGLCMATLRSPLRLPCGPSCESWTGRNRARAFGLSFLPQA